MWPEFVITVAAQMAFLICPGYLLIRSIGLPKLPAVLFAPGVSASILFIICFLIRMLGLSCTWQITLIPPLAIGAIALAIRRGMRKPDLNAQLLPSVTARHLISYLAIGIIVGIYAILLPLGDPTNFVQENDNGSHLNRLREYIDTGAWNLFSGGFYPCGWHVIAAASSSLTNVDVTVAENATTWVFSSAVFPLSMLSLIGTIVRNDSKPIAYGAVLASAFVAYPWGLIQFGPLFPNMSSYAIFPALAALFINTVEAFARKKCRVATSFCFATLFLSCVGLHQNTVFLAIAFLTPYCIATIYEKSRSVRTKARSIGICFLFSMFVVAIWCAFFKTPFLQSIVSTNWPSYNTIPQSILDILLFKMTERSMQPILGLLVVASTAICLAKSRYRWLACSYLIFAIFFVVDTATDGFVKQLFTGFWYTDPCRISACLAIAAIPVASLGLGEIHCRLLRLFPIERNKKYIETAFIAIACGLIVITVYAPQRMANDYRYSDYFAFDDLRMKIHAHSIGDEAIYTIEERAFVNDVIKLIGNSPVINNVDDGSLFAYGADGLNTHYRTPSFQIPDLPEQGEAESYENWIIRSRLSAVATTEDVRSALDDSGIQYVMLLDADGSDEQKRKLLGYSDKKWSGIDAITSDTPGFETVIENGDMRLYRISEN